jgi:hypothetical protein
MVNNDEAPPPGMGRGLESPSSSDEYRQHSAGPDHDQPDLDRRFGRSLRAQRKPVMRICRVEPTFAIATAKSLTSTPMPADGDLGDEP